MEGFKSKVEIVKPAENLSPADIETRLNAIEDEISATESEDMLKALKDEKYSLMEKLVTYKQPTGTAEKIPDSSIIEELKDINPYEAKDNIPGLEM